MKEVTGTFHGEVTHQSAHAIPDESLHALVIVTVNGVQKSDDGNWHGAKLTYSGMGDILAGNGTQSGYFSNEHVGGDTTFGTFEGKVTMDGFTSRTVGKWQLVRGTGRFSGISGGGSFEATTTGPITVQMMWSGEYTLR